MTLFAALQGSGGGRIPMAGFSYAVSRRDLVAIIESMPTDLCRAMHIAAQTGDIATAQRLLREATATYFSSAPAAPAAAVALSHSTRRPRRTRIEQVC